MLAHACNIIQEATRYHLPTYMHAGKRMREIISIIVFTVLSIVAVLNLAVHADSFHLTTAPIAICKLTVHIFHWLAVLVLS